MSSITHSLDARAGFYDSSLDRDKIETSGTSLSAGEKRPGERAFLLRAFAERAKLWDA